MNFNSVPRPSFKPDQARTSEDEAWFKENLAKMKQNIKIIKKCKDTHLIDKYYYGDVNLDEIHK